VRSAGKTQFPPVRARIDGIADSWHLLWTTPTLFA
jgi:hypothetical protein